MKNGNDFSKNHLNGYHFEDLNELIMIIYLFFQSGLPNGRSSMLHAVPVRSSPEFSDSQFSRLE